MRRMWVGLGAIMCCLAVAGCDSSEDDARDTEVDARDTPSPVDTSEEVSPVEDVADVDATGRDVADTRAEPDAEPPPDAEPMSDADAAADLTGDADAAQDTVPDTEPELHWTPGSVSSVQIFLFDNVADFEAHYQSGVEIVNLDLEEVEDYPRVVEIAHDAGSRVVCYTSSGYEEWRNDADEYPEEALGGPICRNSSCTEVWPGERWGKISEPALHDFLARRMDRAAAVGCDGIELDNVDVAWNQVGFSITPEENLAALLELDRLANARGLAYFVKNTPDLADVLAPSAEGVFIEECHTYRECDAYQPYEGKAVVMIEYSASCTARDWAVCREAEDYFEVY